MFIAYKRISGKIGHEIDIDASASSFIISPVSDASTSTSPSSPSSSTDDLSLESYLDLGSFSPQMRAVQTVWTSGSSSPIKIWRTRAAAWYRSAV
jgi:hypothetical protein